MDATPGGSQRHHLLVQLAHHPDGALRGVDGPHLLPRAPRPAAGKAAGRAGREAVSGVPGQPWPLAVPRKRRAAPVVVENERESSRSSDWRGAGRAGWTGNGPLGAQKKWCLKSAMETPGSLPYAATTSMNIPHHHHLVEMLTQKLHVNISDAMPKPSHYSG